MAIAPSDTEQAEQDKSRLQELVAFFAEHGRFDAAVSRNTSVISIDKKTQIAEFEFKVTPDVCSRLGTLHGGAAATILDDHTSVWLSFLSSSELAAPNHVSRTITTTYLRPALEGQTVRVRTWPVAVGKKMANLYGEIRSLDGKVLVTCIHDKAIVPRDPKGPKL